MLANYPQLTLLCEHFKFFWNGGLLSTKDGHILSHHIQGVFFNWFPVQKVLSIRLHSKSHQKSSKCQNLLTGWHFLELFGRNQLKNNPGRSDMTYFRFQPSVEIVLYSAESLYLFCSLCHPGFTCGVLYSKYTGKTEGIVWHSMDGYPVVRMPLQLILSFTLL